MRSLCCAFAAFGCLAQAQFTLNSSPSRVFGQHALSSPITSVAPNLVEGREFYGPSAIAIDTSASPPILYVADTLNSRVLAWVDPDSFRGCGVTADTNCGRASFVIGQADFYSTLAQRPDSTTTHGFGLNQPTGLAVDAAGNLYVADAGNQRILRFPKPAQQTGLIQADLVIGQSTVTSAPQSNLGQTAPSAQSLFLCCQAGGFAPIVGLAFDPSGNLWVADPGNNRVLRFPGPNAASNQLAPNTALPAADMVIGQADLLTGTLNANASPTNPSALGAPAGLAIDSTGNLYVADGFDRVLFFQATGGALQSSQSASRLLGLPASGGAPASDIYTLASPQGIFLAADALYVCDSPAHRVVSYDVPAKWPAASTATPSPAARAVIGQANFTSRSANRGQIEPDAGSLNLPSGGAALNGEIWIADTLNHRVLGFAPNAALATHLLGQLDFPFNAPNLIEGREVSFSSGGAAGIAIDKRSNPPHLYIADAQNNRVLGFKDARHITPGTRADIVIGQPDFFRALINYPKNDPDLPTQTGLNAPAGLAVDADGNLLVADSGNGRVLRFPSPFTQDPTTVQKADLVLGQASFTSSSFDASQSSAEKPFGLALFSDGSLAVSDRAFHRVTIFRRSGGADFSNGQAAATVLGQSNFVTTASGAGSNALFGPTHIAVDAEDRLYICDTGNGRVLIYAGPLSAANGAFANFVISDVATPFGITVNPANGEFWVADANAGTAYHYPNYDTLVLTGGKQLHDQALASGTPIAVAFDSFGNLIVAELVNRVSFYFPILAFRNTANYNNLPVAPGSLIYIARPAVDFSFTPASAATLPWPPSLSNVQVLMNGTTPCPIFSVTSNLVFFQVPNSAPTSGFADFQVSDVNTGQIFADYEIPMAVANPGFYTANASGTGQAAALNLPDYTPNSASNPVLKDGKHYLQFYLTGLGAVPGGPPDGVAPASPVPAPQPTIFVAQGCVGGFCPDSSIQFSGLAGYPGVWVINFLVPETSNAGCGNVVAVGYDNILSNRGPNGLIQVFYCAK